jgi:hypothetical protein
MTMVIVALNKLDKVGWLYPSRFHFAISGIPLLLFERLDGTILTDAAAGI